MSHQKSSNGWFRSKVEGSILICVGVLGTLLVQKAISLVKDKKQRAPAPEPFEIVNIDKNSVKQMDFVLDGHNEIQVIESGKKVSAEFLKSIGDELQEYLDSGKGGVLLCRGVTSGKLYGYLWWVETKKAPFGVYRDRKNPYLWVYSVFTVEEVRCMGVGTVMYK